MEKKTIGLFLCALRKASGLTQRQLAEKLNVSDKAVSRWERDECAPDLTLIPVLAEIYGVTSDEILRGQRNNPDATNRAADSIKADKQRKHLLSRTMSKFCIHSVISVGIAIIGLILISICNFELHEAAIAFLLGAILFAVSIFAQITFTISDFSSIQDDEWTDLSLVNSKGIILLSTESIISLLCILFTGTIPLAGKSHEVVSLFTCVHEGIPYVLVTAAACVVACLVINLVVFRRISSRKNGLRIICTGIASFLLIGLLIGQVFLNTSLMHNRHLYAPCDKFTTLKAFQIRIEKEFAPDGSSMSKYRPLADGYIYKIHGTDETIILKNSDIHKQLIEKDVPSGYYDGDHFIADYGYEFQHLNRNIVYYELSDGDEIVPIYTFTVDQLEVANQIVLSRLFQYSILYLIPIILTISIYLILRRKFA